MKYITYIGHNTDAKKEGIRILATDAETGKFELLRTLNVENAIYMALNKDMTRLYTTLSSPEFGATGRVNGGLAAYEIQGDNLKLINQIATGRTTPCHVSMASDEKAIVYAEYGCATAGACELEANGALGKLQPTIELTGEVGPNKPRQDKPHSHCAIVTPDNKYLCVVDLGLDQIKVYDYANRMTNGGFKELTDKTIHTLPAGAGPRHIIFHPNGKLCFVIFELGNLVTSFRYDGESFQPVMTLPLLPGEFRDFSKAAAIKLSEDGTRLFCSNRGHDSITVFAVNPDNGEMTRLKILKLGGEFPRDFEFAPGGKVLLAGLKMSGIMRSYIFDRDSCSIEPVMDMRDWYRPLYVKFGKAI